MADDDIIPGPGPAEYYLVKCPRLGKYRASVLCETVCYDTNNSSRKCNEARRKCPAWQKLREKRKNGELPKLPTYSYED